MLSKSLIFRQLFDRSSCTYTYLLGDANSRNALLIDPVLELVNRDLKLIEQLNLKLKYVLNTHVHADHVTGSGKIKEILGKDVQSIISKSSGAQADKFVCENDCIDIGDEIKLKVFNTPGHTNGCVTFVDHQNRFAFTGDALLIRGCGRTDFQEGSSFKLYDSIWQKILSLPDDCLLFPAHDYNGATASSVREEKNFNPRLTKSKSEFIEIMNNLNLDKPKLIDVAVPKNLKCGI